jgi:hypothetical protein
VCGWRANFVIAAPHVITDINIYSSAGIQNDDIIISRGSGQANYFSRRACTPYCCQIYSRNVMMRNHATSYYSILHRIAAADAVKLVLRFTVVIYCCHYCYLM